MSMLDNLLKCVNVVEFKKDPKDPFNMTFSVNFKFTTTEGQRVYFFLYRIYNRLGDLARRSKRSA